MANLNKFHLYGAPYDVGTNAETTQGIDSKNGPAALRRLLKQLYDGFNIPLAFTDFGDIKAKETVESVLNAVEEKAFEILQTKSKFAFIGGAHTITLGSLRAAHKATGGYSLIYIDTHPDIMPESNIHYGSIIFHAINEGVLNPDRILYVGIRQIEQEEEELIARYNIKCIRGEEFLTPDWPDKLEQLKKDLPPPYMMSIDLDALDPTFAPGISCPYPFGLSPREMLYVAKSFCGPDLLGFDILELAPRFDQGDRTARLTAVTLHEITKATFKK
jgi:agmatinase